MVRKKGSKFNDCATRGSHTHAVQLSTAASEMRRVIQRAADKFEVELLLSEQLSSSSSSILVVSTAGSNLVRPGFESGKQEIRCFFELPIYVGDVWTLHSCRSHQNKAQPYSCKI